MSSLFEYVQSDEEEQVWKRVTYKINEVALIVLDSFLSNL